MLLMANISTVDIIIVGILILLSGLFSGLNLGLLSLDTNELKIIISSGKGPESTINEKLMAKYANAILPVRQYGNWLLCTLLLSNVAVNSYLSIMIAQISTGMIGFLLSTILIVIFGEIIPQSYCTKNGLFVGYYSIWIVKILMGITCILSWSTGKLLDCTVGQDMGTFYSRNQLKNSIEYSEAKEHRKMIEDIIDFPIKTVKDAIKKWEHVYRLEIDTMLTFDKLCEIWKSGYSRIPIYEKEDTNIVTLLYTKELILLGYNVNKIISIRIVVMEHSINIPKVSLNDKLHNILDIFQTGYFSHLALVVNNDELLGIITLEDVIEQLIQEDIIDENDIEAPRNKLIKRNSKSFLQYMTHLNGFLSNQNNDEIDITADFLAHKLPDLFGINIMSNSTLIQFVRSCSVMKVDEINSNIYTNGIEADYMSIVLDGSVEILMGKEELKFTKNVLTIFGIQSLFGTFIPDYSMKFGGLDSKILIVKRDHYKKFCNDINKIS